MASAPSSLPNSYVPYTEFELPRPSATALETPQLEREASSPSQQAQLVRAPALATGAVAARILASPYGPRSPSPDAWRRAPAPATKWWRG